MFIFNRSMYPFAMSPVVVHQALWMFHLVLWVYGQWRQSIECWQWWHKTIVLVHFAIRVIISIIMKCILLGSCWFLIFNQPTFKCAIEPHTLHVSLYAGHCMVCGLYHSFHIFEHTKLPSMYVCFVSIWCSMLFPADRVSYFRPSITTTFRERPIGFPKSCVRRP